MSFQWVVVAAEQLTAI